MTMHDTDSRRNKYLNDPESGGEMARLLEQDRFLTTCMGGLFPERGGDLSGIHDVLDVACGPGVWTQEVASAYPQVRVTGFDISHAMIEYARIQARLQGLENARFEVIDATAPLPFEDASFDLVNARTLAGFMLASAWPALVGECVRILRPGGILRLTETDNWGVTNKPAFEVLMAYAHRSSWLTGHSFDSSGRTFGLTPMLERLMKLAGLRNFSIGTPAWESMYENCRLFFKLVQPYEIMAREAFPDTGIPDQAELDRLYEQMLVEMIQDDFVGILYLLTAWGVKPQSGEGTGEETSAAR